MSLCGTPEYLAPEIIQSIPYGESVDWWSFGVLIYELINGTSPFHAFNKDPMTMFETICSGEFKMPNEFSGHLQDLIRGLLQVDVTKRLGHMKNGSRAIKEHIWFQDIDWHCMLNQTIDPPMIPNLKDPLDCSHFGKSPQMALPRSRTDQFAKQFEEF
uniref:Protein kinase domain-containing protein n=1 Tax=Megaselia scalaris TaxID=36166 RepID=T1H3F0_MEGSC